VVPVDASNIKMEMKYSSGPCSNNSTSFFLLVGEDTLLPSYSIMYGNYYLDGHNHLQIGIGRNFDSATTFFEYIDEKYLQQSLKIIIFKIKELLEALILIVLNISWMVNCYMSESCDLTTAINRG